MTLISQICKFVYVYGEGIYHEKLDIVQGSQLLETCELSNLHLGQPYLILIEKSRQALITIIPLSVGPHCSSSGLTTFLWQIKGSVELQFSVASVPSG